MLNAVIMAGASKSGLLEEQEGMDNKAFVLINGRPMIEFILDVVCNMPDINQIVVVGDTEKLIALKESRGYNFQVLPQGDGFLENMLKGVQVVDRQAPCVIVSADIPLLTREVFTDFLSRCKPFAKEFYYPVISKKDCIERFPTVERTYLTLKEGTYTGGNLMIVKPHWLIDKKERLELYISYRKNPLKIVATLPLRLMLKFLFRRLTFKDMEQYFHDLMGVTGKVVVTPHVEIGVDVDKPSDLALARDLLKQDK